MASREFELSQAASLLDVVLHENNIDTRTVGRIIVEGCHWRVDAVTFVECLSTPEAPEVILGGATGILRFAALIVGWQECRLGRLTKEQSRLGLVSKWNDSCVSESTVRAAGRLIESLVRGDESHLRATM